MEGSYQLSAVSFQPKKISVLAGSGRYLEQAFGEN
jgi:hypothetical protein